MTVDRRQNTMTVDRQILFKYNIENNIQYYIEYLNGDGGFVGWMTVDLLLM